MRLISILFVLLIISIHSFAQNDKAKLANEYYQQGDLDKAKDLFLDLSNKKKAIPLIQANYLNLLQEEGDFKQAEKFLNNALKYYPENIQFQVSILKLYDLSGELDKREKYFKKLDREYEGNQFQLNMLAQNLGNQQMLDESIYFFKKGRKASNNPYAFALDLAAIYRQQKDLTNMTAEYLNYAESNPRNLSYVKNLFQNMLTEEKDQDYLEKALIDKIQRYPDQVMYADLLIWLELQRKNFYAAYIQARALDKRLGNPGDQSMRIGRIALDNDSWDNAIEIFEYVIKEYPNSRNFISAKSLYIQARESKVKNHFPVDLNEIRVLANEYQSLFDQMGPNPSTLDALRSKALLHAFYLDEKDSAIAILTRTIGNRRSPRHLVSKCKLDLGDIYLLTDQPWESTLLYSQVEKSDKESPLGYEAKLRNAKLNYYTGNFSLAKDHLGILKLATTREISNDAIALGILIEDNTVFDSTDVVMQQFANIELLIFQNFKNLAEIELQNMLKKYPGHSITDEIYWIQAQLALEKGDYEKSVEYLDKIVQAFSYDILSDDAFYKKGVILSDHMHNEQEALETFVAFLKAHPGSMYAAEARTRIRKLRGDYIN
ncbi:MAG: tetratricopeptide repeat protein [Cyclobacteriaceae bacterium]